jgi:hypothetical protein
MNSDNILRMQWLGGGLREATAEDEERRKGEADGRGMGKKMGGSEE